MTTVQEDLSTMVNVAEEKKTKKTVTMEETIDLGDLTIVGFDPGSSDNKCAIGDDPEDETQVVCVPNCLKKVDISEVSGLSREMDVDFDFDEYDDIAPQAQGTFNVLNNIYFRHGADGFLAGKAAADRDAGLDLTISKVDNLIEKLIAACIALNVRGDIAVAIAIRHKNQAQYASDRDRAIQMLQNKTINWIYLEEGCSITPKYVFIQPEGLAAVNECMRQGIEFVGKKTAIIDVGELSTDGSLVETDPRTGGISFNRVASCSLDFAMQQFARTVAINEQLPSSQSYELLLAIAKGEKMYRYKSDGEVKTLNLEKVLPSYKDGFSKQLKAKILDWLPVESIDQIVLVGGGSSCFHQELFSYFQLKSGIPTFTVKHPRLATALSLYNFAQARVARALAKGR